jgi:hypothetical protein
MHPDDQPPADRPKPKPKFPRALWVIFTTSIFMLVLAVSGAKAWSAQWWTIIFSWVVFEISFGMFMWRFVNYLAERTTLTINRRDDDRI